MRKRVVFGTKHDKPSAKCYDARVPPASRRAVFFYG